jgi:GTP cyclohydrolase IA
MSDNKTYLSWDDVFERLSYFDKKGCVIYGVPRGGMIATAFLRNAKVTHDPYKATMILDDIIDSGTTRARYGRMYPKIPFLALVDKIDDECRGKWVVFPWERDLDEEAPEDAVIRLLQFIGEDPTREGLKDTPKRVVKALAELTAGYHTYPCDILKAKFTANYNEMVWLKGIRFTSLCEHHLLPFTGTATIAYVPNGKVIGISKLARLVEVFARRLQIQEQMTEQIADAFMDHVQPTGVAVFITAHHQCMGCRGVRQPEAEMVTSCLRGVFLTDSSARAEFLSGVK